VPDHWEGDLLSGPNNSYIATLVERHTRYVMLAKVAGKDTRTAVAALIKQWIDRVRYCIESRCAFAVFRSAVSKPSLKRSYTDCSRLRASAARP
jgi:hypothetical protein